MEPTNSVDFVLRVAAKAVIVNGEGKVLVVREANTYAEGTNIGIYGIPGGRLKPGESYNDGLKREAKEETGLLVEPLYPIFVGEWRPVIKGVPHQIIAVFTICNTKGTIVTLSVEHDDYKWIGEDELATVKFMDPDDKVVERYFEWVEKGVPHAT